MEEFTPSPESRPTFSIGDLNLEESDRRERLREFRAQAKIELKFADEIGAEYSHLQTSLPEQAKKKFNLESSSPPEGLSRLPFVREDQLPRSSHSRSVEIDNFKFPVERIIGAVNFENWTGRRDGHTKLAPDGKAKASLEVIADYAQQMDLEKINVNEPVLVIKDADGEYWGYARDGSHRIAAAKLRGRSHIETDVEIYPEEEIPTLGFSVLERFAESSEEV